MSAAPEDPGALTRSSRDRQALRQSLDTWLATKVPGATVTGAQAPEANGMSSETLLVDATWPDASGTPAPHQLVARVAPDLEDVPVFPTYDLAAQFAVIGIVADHSDVPVPHTHWLETDATVLGAPFFVMDRVEGRIPPDVMPYTFEGWVLDASAAQRQQLQDASVAVLAGIHGIDLPAVAADGTDVSFLEFGDSDASATPLQRHVAHWRAYYDWMRGSGRLPLVDATFDWIDAHWPADEGPTVLSWGDARIGNMIFDGFRPVAVLDWEMAGLGPAGIDVGWMVFLHTFFQDLAEQFGLEGLPDMFRTDDVLAVYRRAGGADLADLHFYVVYAALRHALVMARVHERRVHFGEAEPVTDPDDAIMHRARLEQLISD